MKAGVSKSISSGVRYAAVAYASEATVCLHLHDANKKETVYEALDDIQRVVDSENDLGNYSFIYSFCCSNEQDSVIGLTDLRTEMDSLLFRAKCLIT